MLDFAFICLAAAAPMLAPPHWAWAWIEGDAVAVADTYIRADLPLPTVRYYGGVFLFEQFKQDDVRVYRKDGTQLGLSWLRDKMNVLELPFSHSLDVVVSVGVFPPAARLKHVNEDTPIVVLPRKINTAISFD